MTPIFACGNCLTVYFVNPTIKEIRKIILRSNTGGYKISLDLENNKTSLYQDNTAEQIARLAAQQGLSQQHTISNIVEIKELLPITPDNIEIWIPKLLKLKAFS